MAEVLEERHQAEAEDESLEHASKVAGTARTQETVLWWQGTLRYSPTTGHRILWPHPLEREADTISIVFNIVLAWLQ